ncbi:uncharacterized protein LOC120347616 isoform X2 [Styela clava]
MSRLVINSSSTENMDVLQKTTDFLKIHYAGEHGKFPDDFGPVIHIQRQNEGPLTPVHYIVIVLIIYMGGIAVLIMKSVQRDNEVRRYANYYENFVKRPQFKRPQLLPNYTLRRSWYKSRIHRGSCTPSHVETVTDVGSVEVFDLDDHHRCDSISATAQCTLHKQDKHFDKRSSAIIVVNAMPASTQTEIQDV